MANLRKTPSVAENAPLYTQFALLVTDVLNVLRRAGNRLLGLVPLAAVVADLTALRSTVAALVTDVAAMRTAYQGLLGKLDADSGVGDTNYAATSGMAALTSTAPSALTTTTTIGIANGTTAGKLKLSADAFYSIGGTLYRKAATDDLWNLSAQTDTTGAQYRAIALYLDASGTASIGAGANAASAAAAIAALPSTPSTKALIGVFVAGLSTDFDGVGGLSGQGTIYNGHPGEASSDALAATSITLVAA